jgi:hypothetical protein
MSDLVAFLTARLDEKEQGAGDQAFALAGHYHDPARVLREVKAGRMILARYEDCLARQEDDDYPAGTARDQAREYEDFVLPNLATIDSTHPGYDPEWDPDF